MYANCISLCLCVHMAWPGQETWGAPGRWEEDGPAAATRQWGDAFANGEKWRTWFLWDDLWTKMFRFDWIPWWEEIRRFGEEKRHVCATAQGSWKKDSCLCDWSFSCLPLFVLQNAMKGLFIFWFFLHFLLCFTMSQSSFWVIALAVLVSDSCLSDVEAEACPVRCRKMGVRRQEGNSCRHHESLVQSHGAHRTSVLSVTFVLLVLHDGMIWGYVLDSKKRARRAQGVHDAMLKSLLGEAQTYGGDRF